MAYPNSLDSFTTKVDGTDYPQASHINVLQVAVEALEVKVGIDGSSASTSLDYKVNNFFTSGRKLWLYEDTAPTGWTTVSLTDKVLAVKGGTGNYNITGGNASADSTWTINHNHMWYDFQMADDSWSFTSSGSSADISSGNNFSNGIRALHNSSVEKLNQDYYTAIEHIQVTTDRYPAAVGIVVEKD